MLNYERFSYTIDELFNVYVQIIGFQIEGNMSKFWLCMKHLVSLLNIDIVFKGMNTLIRFVILLHYCF